MNTFEGGETMKSKCSEFQWLGKCFFSRNSRKLYHQWLRTNGFQTRKFPRSFGYSFHRKIEMYSVKGSFILNQWQPKDDKRSFSKNVNIYIPEGLVTHYPSRNIHRCYQRRVRVKRRTLRSSPESVESFVSISFHQSLEHRRGVDTFCQYLHGLLSDGRKTPRGPLSPFLGPTLLSRSPRAARV